MNTLGNSIWSNKTGKFCGYPNSELTLKDRVWKCPDWTTKHNTYITIAIKIKKIRSH
jgi:putative transposase